MVKKIIKRRKYKREEEIKVIDDGNWDSNLNPFFYFRPTLIKRGYSAIYRVYLG